MSSEGRVVPFDQLATADLIVDAIYRGGQKGHVGDDPISRLVGGGNLGGFRYVGNIDPFNVRYCVLYSELDNADWPDRLDIESGTFVYYGDNRSYGADLHETTRQGNALLRETFHRLHSHQRSEIPPFFVFTKAGGARDVMFRGLAVPGAAGVSEVEDLVAVWRAKRERRFQNYRATFTILDVRRIGRDWLKVLKSKNPVTDGAPAAWLEWRSQGTYRNLEAPRTREYRTPAEQIPPSGHDLNLLRYIVSHYAGHPDGRYAFERCAAELFRLLDPHVRSIDLTRPWRDGGRDALGQYGVGTPPSTVTVEFALEAKCKEPETGNSSGVRDTARLIARIRHRQFGVFVTTSCVGEQAYQELVEDGHPIVVIAGADIVRILKNHGLSEGEALEAWLGELDRSPSPRL